MGFLVGPTAMAIYGIAGLAAAGVGLGMQYNAQKQAAQQQEALAKYNYAIQAQNIKQQTAIAQWQARAQAQQMQGQAAMAGMQAQTAAKNAQRIHENARIVRQTGEMNLRMNETNAGLIEEEAQKTVNRGVENQRRTREDQMRMSAIQRARIAKSGVAAAGTPIEVLSESARDMMLTRADDWWQTNQERTSLLWDATVQRYEGQVAKYKTDVDAYNLEVDAASMMADSSRYTASASLYSGQASLLRSEALLAPIQARMQMRQAAYERLSGLNNAYGIRSGANAGLVSGFGSLLGNAFSMFDVTPKSPTTSPPPTSGTSKPKTYGV